MVMGSTPFKCREGLTKTASSANVVFAREIPAPDGSAGAGLPGDRLEPRLVIPPISSGGLPGVTAAKSNDSGQRLFCPCGPLDLRNQAEPVETAGSLLRRPGTDTPTPLASATTASRLLAPGRHRFEATAIKRPEAQKRRLALQLWERSTALVGY